MNDDYLMTLLGITIFAVIISLTITTFGMLYGRDYRYQKIDKEVIKGYFAMSTWLFLVIWAVSIIIESFVTCTNWQYQKLPWC
tara:strand:- start:224 stop:472 length:249 start_codon:yes stop_codon:yes gene_type:complete